MQVPNKSGSWIPKFMLPQPVTREDQEIQAFLPPLTTGQRIDLAAGSAFAVAGVALLFHVLILNSPVTPGTDNTVCDVNELNQKLEHTMNVFLSLGVLCIGGMMLAGVLPFLYPPRLGR